MNGRAIQAITRKDIGEVLRNPWLALGVLMPIALALLLRVAFPSVLIEETESLTIAVYDPGGSQLTALLRALPDVVVQEVRDEAELVNATREGLTGLAVPLGFDAALQAGVK